MRRLSVLVVVALLLVACRSDASDPIPGPGGTFTDCPPVTPPANDIHVPGLIVPRGSVVLSKRPTGQRLTRVRGYVDLTPLQVFAFYKKLERTKGYEFFLLENEVIEAEAFFTDGKHRNYITARTACIGRSDLFLFVAPEDYSKPG